MRIKKMLASIITLSILFCISAPVYASPNKSDMGHNIKSLVSSIGHREERDINKLLSMTKSKVTNIEMTSNNIKIPISANVSMVEQVIEERVFTDGSLENVIALNYIVQPDPIPYTSNTGIHDMTFVVRAYITDRSPDGYSAWERRCDKVETIYYKHGSLPFSVTKVVLGYEGYNNPADFNSKFQTFNYPSASSTYTLLPQDKFYLQSGNYWFALYASAQYFISDGKTLNLFLDLGISSKNQ